MWPGIFNVMNTLLHLGDLYQAMEEYEQANTVWYRALVLANTLHDERFVTALQKRLAQLATASDLDFLGAH